MIQAITCTYRKVLVFPLLLMLCFSDAAFYYVNFYMTKQNHIVWNTINDNDELIYSFLGWAHLLSTIMVPAK